MPKLKRETSRNERAALDLFRYFQKKTKSNKKGQMLKTNREPGENIFRLFKQHKEDTDEEGKSQSKRRMQCAINHSSIWNDPQFQDCASFVNECCTGMDPTDRNFNWPAYVLTQHQQTIVDSIERKVESNASKMEMIERVCHHWRENVRLIFTRLNLDDMKTAKCNVEKCMCDLWMFADESDQYYNATYACLELFQYTLAESISSYLHKKIMY